MKRVQVVDIVHKTCLELNAQGFLNKHGMAMSYADVENIGTHLWKKMRAVDEGKQCPRCGSTSILSTSENMGSETCTSMTCNKCGHFWDKWWSA